MRDEAGSAPGHVDMARSMWQGEALNRLAEGGRGHVSPHDRSA